MGLTLAAALRGSHLGPTLSTLAAGADERYYRRVRGLERVALHADLTMLARLSQALARARAVPLAA